MWLPATQNLGISANQNLSLLCDTGQVTESLCAFASSSEKWRVVGGLNEMMIALGTAGTNADFLQALGPNRWPPFL